MAALHYDAVVIGAGNGGLAAALTLADAGKKVLLAERHNLPGGFATSFVRGRFEFEASLHELCDFGTPGNSGNLYALFEELGVLDKIEFVTVPEAYSCLLYTSSIPTARLLSFKIPICRLRSAPGLSRPLTP